MDMVELAETVAIEIVHHGRHVVGNGSLVCSLATGVCVARGDRLVLNQVESVIGESRSVSDSGIRQGAGLARWQADERRV